MSKRGNESYKDYLDRLRKENEELIKDIPPLAIESYIKIQVNGIIRSLIDLGVVEADHMIVFEVSFAEVLNEYLKGSIKFFAEQQAEASKQAGPKLVLPPDSKLITPN